MRIYLNNAATSYPKPREVIEAVTKSLIEPPVEVGKSMNGIDHAIECRNELSALFNVADPSHVILTSSATLAMNQIILGHLQNISAGHVVTTTLEHNSVLRPLEHLRRNRGLQISFVEPEADGSVHPEEIAAAIRNDTRLIAVTHASNVTGSIQPVEKIARICSAADVPFLIDASQSAGAVELDYQKLPGQVYIVFTGHKALYGPTGTGGMIIPNDRMDQIIVGGTGVNDENPFHPPWLPLRYEAGTANLCGIAGLNAGVRHVNEKGVINLGHYRHLLVQSLRSALEKIEGIRLTPLARNDGRTGIVSFTHENAKPEEISYMLLETFGIETCSGLHGAPLIHRSLSTKTGGTVRVSVSAFNNEREIIGLAECLQTVLATCAC